MAKRYTYPSKNVFGDFLLVDTSLIKHLIGDKKSEQPLQIEADGNTYPGRVLPEYNMIGGIEQILGMRKAEVGNVIIEVADAEKGRAPRIVVALQHTAGELGGMYLGLHHKSTGAAKKLEGTPYQLDPKRLRTHTFICGRTGSGKTVLTKAIVEEALLQGIPVVVIDLKGDLASLGIVPLAMTPKEFAEFCGDEDENPQTKLARAVAEQEKTKQRLSNFKLTEADSRKLKDSIHFRVFTPRASYGAPLSLAGQLSAPDNIGQIRKQDPDLYSEMCSAVTDAFLDRLYPTANRQAFEKERAFMHTLIQYCWSESIPLAGEHGLRTLREYVIEPPFEEIGGVRVADFLGPRRVRLRDKLATQLAVPEIEWFRGEPLNASILVESRDGKTPLTIISVSHLNTFEDRAFVVAQVAYVLTSWMRTQGETDTPRVLLVVDEIGAQGGPSSLFPSYPKDPPSKRFLSQIIRQGRSFGVCGLLATQNPSDIDYKALGNCGLWLAGSLLTNRDRTNVLQGMGLDDMRRDLTQGWIAGAGEGEFVIRDVPIPSPFMIRVRWLHTYHRGLERSRLEQLSSHWPDTKKPK